ncbi:MAG: LysR family transcriptional regulator [Nannocystaceae bacterium]
MDWNDLRYVLAIAREGTLLRAAAAVGVAHTTVGRRLRTLEDQLGVRLFDRTPDGLVATAAGEDLTAVAEQVEEQVLAAEGRVLGRDAQLRGPLRVSTFDALFYGFEAAFTAFMSRYPSVDLVVTTSRDEVSLTRREADVVIRLSSAPPQTLVGRKVGYVQFAVYASRALVEHVGDQAALSDYPWIGWEGGPNLRWFEGWLEHNAPGAEVVLRMDYEAPLVAHAIRSGIGAQILPCFLADPDPLLQRIAPLDDRFRLDLWLLTLPELRTNSRVRAFTQHMADALTEHRDALAGRVPAA